MSILRRSAFVFGLLAATAACSSNASNAPDGIEAKRHATASPIVHGIASDASQDAVVLLLHSAGDYVDYCTGTLIAPNLVLTARHCVSETGEDGFSCGADGVGSVEGAVGADFAPSSITIFTGVGLPGASDPATATGKQIIHDGATNLCNHDLALLLLDKDVPDAKLAALRLTDTTKPGEVVTAVGWGVTEKTFDPETRMQRTGITIRYVGTDRVNDVASNEFEVGESICDGDSGGPALASSGAIVGIVSRGGNDDPSPNPDVPGADCIDPGASNDYTKVSGFTSVILTAFDAAGHTPIREGETPAGDSGPVLDGSVADTGAPAETGTELDSGADVGTTPPAAATDSSSGCSTSGSPANASSWAFSLLALGASIARAVRRRSSR